MHDFLPRLYRDLALIESEFEKAIAKGPNLHDFMWIQWNTLLGTLSLMCMDAPKDEPPDPEMILMAAAAAAEDLRDDNGVKPDPVEILGFGHLPNPKWDDGFQKIKKMMTRIVKCWLLWDSPSHNPKYAHEGRPDPTYEWIQTVVRSVGHGHPIVKPFKDQLFQLLERSRSAQCHPDGYPAEGGESIYTAEGDESADLPPLPTPISYEFELSDSEYSDVMGGDPSAAAKRRVATHDTTSTRKKPRIYGS